MCCSFFQNTHKKKKYTTGNRTIFFFLTFLLSAVVIKNRNSSGLQDASTKQCVCVFFVFVFVFFHAYTFEILCLKCTHRLLCIQLKVIRPFLFGWGHWVCPFFKVFYKHAYYFINKSKQHTRTNKKKIDNFIIFET